MESANEYLIKHGAWGSDGVFIPDPEFRYRVYAKLDAEKRKRKAARKRERSHNRRLLREFLKVEIMEDDDAVAE